MLEKKASECHITLDELIWNYINRGLMGDSLNEDDFKKWHSEEFLKEVNDTLNVDYIIEVLLWQALLSEVMKVWKRSLVKNQLF